MIVDRFGAMILVVVKYMFNAFVTFIAFLRVQVPKKGRKENKLWQMCIRDRCMTHAGITLGEDGGSHQAIEDLALMRVIPGMTVVVPCCLLYTSRCV